MAPWRGATWRRTSACAPPTARWRAARWKTGPSRYQDLEPYYEKAEWEMGVSGDVQRQHRSRRRGGKPLPMPPLPPNREHQILHPAAKRLGLHPFDIPMLRNTRALQRPRRLHALPLVRRVRLRSERAHRHAQHRHPHGARHRKLRTAHRVHDEGDPARQPRPRHRRGLFRCRKAACRSRPPTW